MGIAPLLASVLPPTPYCDQSSTGAAIRSTASSASATCSTRSPPSADPGAEEIAVGFRLLFPPHRLGVVDQALDDQGNGFLGVHVADRGARVEGGAGHV